MKRNIKDILAKYWIVAPPNVHSQIDSPNLTAYHHLVEEREVYREHWGRLLHDLKESDRFGRIRDMEYSTEPHTFKLVLPVKDHAHRGIILCISMIGKQVGLYFSDYQQETLMPIMNCTTPFQVSYYPFSEEQEELARFVLDIAFTHFPDFEKFDNTYASEEIRNVMIGPTYYEKIDMFQAVFCPNVHGMI